MKYLLPLLSLIIVLLIVALFNNNDVDVDDDDLSTQTMRSVHWAMPTVTREQEFREPPLKVYKPPVFQQMGLLTNPDGKILPLYGKESTAYRNRFNYYTTTPGNQIYSLPVTHNSKDCTEDIGCEEFYGNEDISVTGMDGDFKAEIYRNKNIQLL